MKETQAVSFACRVQRRAVQPYFFHSIENNSNVCYVQTKLIGAMDALGDGEHFEPSTASPADRTAAHRRAKGAKMCNFRTHAAWHTSHLRR